MKKRCRRLLALLCVFAVAFAMIATVSAHSGRTDAHEGHNDNQNKSGLGGYHYHCGGAPAHLHTNGYCPYQDVFPTGVTVHAEKTTLGRGETLDLSAVVSPDAACDKNVSWTSSAPEIVSISDGTICAKEYGTATITAKTFNEIAGSVTITVKEIKVEKVTLSGLPEECYIGDTLYLNAALTPEKVDDPSIVWQSSNEAVAVVKDGTVKLLAAGEVEISATASSGALDRVKLCVQEKYVETVEIEEETLELWLGEQRLIRANVLPKDATFPELAWISSEPSVATVAPDGTVTALACGETTITATAANGVSDFLRVRVSEICAESLTLSCPQTLLLGETTSVAAHFLPTDTTIQDITWSVDDPAIAEISDDGVVTAKQVGTVEIRAVQKDVSAVIRLQVLPIAVERILLRSAVGNSIRVGENAQFSATVAPGNATAPEVYWSVSDPALAQINENGLLTAKKRGTVRVIAASADGCTEEFVLTIRASAATVTVIITASALLAAAAAVVIWKKRQH